MLTGCCHTSGDTVRRLGRTWGFTCFEAFQPLRLRHSGAGGVWVYRAGRYTGRKYPFEIGAQIRSVHWQL